MNTDGRKRLRKPFKNEEAHHGSPFVNYSPVEGNPVCIPGSIKGSNDTFSLKGSGAGLVLIHPSGAEYTYALRLNFVSSNNEAESEALLAGLRITRKMKDRRQMAAIREARYKTKMEQYYNQKNSKTFQAMYFSFGRHLEELHVTRAHLEKKRTRLRTNTKTLEDLCSQSLETASQAIHDAVTTHQVTTSQFS
ncbi:MAK10-like protein [Tanacetum coccineum]|uniref:MAK10-like protein n=1 Tax=Tanacetum coccineum TaxID=301880 RepID=A0ABQ4WV02_9ASTR